jgi:hypothetical protein
MGWHMRFQHLKRWRLTAEKALASKKADRPNFSTIAWEVAGNCTAPIYREYKGSEMLNAGIASTSTRSRGPQMTVELHVRCRGCDNCLKARAAHWRYKCKAEIGVAPRTWFGSLTFRPELQYRATCAVELRLLARGTQLAQVGNDELFRLIAVELGKEITKYLKRLRKAGAQIRYVVVAEAHKSGRPHFHMLVHETSSDHPVRHKMLADKWTPGFSNWKLVEGPGAANYVTKYLSKSMRARIRASEEYGCVNDLGHIPR